MSKNSLHKAYDRLTPEERFRLDVWQRREAISRSPSASRGPASGSPTP